MHYDPLLSSSTHIPLQYIIHGNNTKPTMLPWRMFTCTNITFRRRLRLCELKEWKSETENCSSKTLQQNTIWKLCLHICCHFSFNRAHIRACMVRWSKHFASISNRIRNCVCRAPSTRHSLWQISRFTLENYRHRQHTQAFPVCSVFSGRLFVAWFLLLLLRVSIIHCFSDVSKWNLFAIVVVNFA